jgi:phage-related protein
MSALTYGEGRFRLKKRTIPPSGGSAAKRASAATDKPLVWLENEVKSPPFSAAARREAGLLLRRLQRGEKLNLPHSRPMPAIGRRCHELRIPDQDKAWRIVYRIDHDAIIIWEVFAKKGRTTPRYVIEACKMRIKAYDSL